jgi:hypothetical protein
MNENQSLKDRAEKTVREAKLSPYNVGVMLIQAEGFKNEGDKWQLNIEGEVIEWIPSVNLASSDLKKLISEICQASLQNSADKELKAWQKLHTQIGVPHTKKRIMSVSLGREIFQSFSYELRRLGRSRKLTTIVIVKITKGIEAIMPYMQYGHRFDPARRLDRFKRTFPL